VLLFLLENWRRQEPSSDLDPVLGVYLPPLVMQGGDPYIRALMRTISASEANDARPYSVLYGGRHITDLSHHPSLCVTILTGVNAGNCSTAAGRYQLVDKTWLKEARRYHPQPLQLLSWKVYGFEPEFQDRVVYSWLSDPRAWNADFSQMLRQGRLNEVLRRLSSTWTSLGYGVETNSLTRRLPSIYRKTLREELGTIE
jgi:muramidase (phage lysozyme)